MIGAAKESFDLFHTIKSYWEKPIGIILTLFAASLIYYGVAKELMPQFIILEPYNTILLVILITLIIIWLITTHRILLDKSNKLGVFVCINCDQDFEFKAKSIFEKAINELNKDQELKMLYSGLLPFNKFSDQKEIEKWLDNQNGNYNAIIFLKIKNGKIDSEDAIKIDGVSYTGYFRNNNLAINGESLNIMQDLNLRLQGKDWNYLEKNCLNDKEKLRDNIKDLILYYGGMFYLNENHFENSRIILKKIYKPSLAIVTAKTNTTTNELEIKPNHIQAGRLNFLLTNIYLKCVIDKYNSDNTQEAIKLLHEVETFPTPPEIKSSIYTNLAYMYYMVDDLIQSKHYTTLIHTVNPKSFAYLINLGFYSIIDNNPIAFSQHYSIIDENCFMDSQPIEVIAFLNDRTDEYPNATILIESAEAILTKIFVDEQDGNAKLKALEHKIPNSNNYKALKRLVEKNLKRKLPKKIQRQLHKIKKAA